MAMIKKGSLETAIHKYCQRDCVSCGRCSFVKIAEKTFGCSQTFPSKYNEIFGQYIRVMTKIAKAQNKMGTIGEYDPEFHYYRVIGLHADVPNDNGDMFRWGNANDSNEPELLRYDDGINKFVYQSFIGRGNFKNHQNDDVSKAVGIVLDAIPNHNGRFIENLIAVDEKKDAELIRAIDKGYISSVSMGCVIPGTEIYTINGIEKIENINQGDIVLTHQGNYKKVLQINVRHYKGIIYDVRTQNNFDSLIITDEHPVWVLRFKQDSTRDDNKKECPVCKQEFKQLASHLWQKQDEEHLKYFEMFNSNEFIEDFVETKDLLVGDYVGIPINREIKNDLNSNKDFARLLGYYLAEGNFIKNLDKEVVEVCWTFNIKEELYVDEIKQCLLNLYPDANVRLYVREDRNTREIRIYNPEFARLIKEYGGEYSHCKKLNPKVLFWGPEIQKELIGAYLNGDGGQNKAHQTLVATSVSKELILGIRYLLLRNNIISAICKDSRNIYTLSILSTELNKLGRVCDYQPYENYDYITGKNGYIKTNTADIKQTFIKDNRFYFKIKNIIIRNYDGDVHNFEVEDDNSYVASNIAVHNCRCQYSLCSICNNKAVNESQFCDHIKSHKGQEIWHEGAFKKVYEDNRGVNFIELSWVTVPADRNAKLLEKIASDLNSNEFDAITLLVDIYGENGTRKILEAIKKL